jgi:hypothetical protein
MMDMFMNQPWYAMAGEMVVFANTVTMAMPTRFRDNVIMDFVSQVLNFLSMNIFHNKNMDDPKQ